MTTSIQVTIRNTVIEIITAQSQHTHTHHTHTNTHTHTYTTHTPHHLGGATETQAYWRQAEASIHRRACLRIISGRPQSIVRGHLRLAIYSTAGHCSQTSRTRLYYRRHDDGGLVETTSARRRSERWQALWDQSTKVDGRTGLIQDIKGWVERRHGEMSYHLTQFLSGHGYSNIRPALDNNTTPAHGARSALTQPKNVEHVFFHCTRFEHEREEAQMRLTERIEPDNIVRFHAERPGKLECGLHPCEGSRHKTKPRCRRAPRTRDDDNKSTRWQLKGGWGPH
ncbi:unnamed protein product [Trichogramma brassicae]|uniref:Uncharacterized protein n=1 Tax=Trichogramma brassicae TaxID=86971 RepID=A0A6H5J0P9_9HYME|nr:unnamed protein product [Trichogramma brassicae]